MSLTSPDPKASESQPIQEIIHQILRSRRISRSDQQQLMGLLLSQKSLSSEDQSQVDIIFDRLSRGLIHVVD